MFAGVTFVVIHTAISLIALLLGIPAIAGLVGRPVAPKWTGWFVVFALATSVTGFLFPFTGVTPAFATGIVATLVLAATIWARYGALSIGAWRWVDAAGIVVSTYLLAFVTVVQAFLKIPPLKALAPTGSEPPFAIVQGLVLLAFVAVGFFAVRTYRPRGMF